MQSVWNTATIATLRSDPSDYDGGELITDLTPGGHSTKLPAGDPELTQLYACYYNLVRMWAEV